MEGLLSGTRSVTATSLLLAAAVASGACQASGEKTGWMVLADMYVSLAYDAYDPNPNTPNGQTLLLPPEGTVPVDFHPFDYLEGEPEAIRAGEELLNPFQPTPVNLERGKEVYETICIVCHGPGGEGDGPIIGRFPNPPNLLAEHARSYPDGRIYHVITRGQGLMPSHAVQVRPDDRWKTILYVRQLQEGGP